MQRTKWKRHRMNLKKQIHDLLKVLEWETDGRPGADSCYLFHLDDSLMMKGEEGGKPVEWMLIPMWVLGHWNEIGLDLVFHRRG